MTTQERAENAQKEARAKYEKAITALCEVCKENGGCRAKGQCKTVDTVKQAAAAATIWGLRYSENRIAKQLREIGITMV